ncbi:endo alpha-1,4 polygalactosaminidase [Catenulispora subtropica]|uniref:Fibronectin type-III domain-containing protein n=1 Tax=Catenulispora subtropica TaxID=450798 RepID=A0ABN2T1F8_9ACTN
MSHAHFLDARSSASPPLWRRRLTLALAAALGLGAAVAGVDAAHAATTTTLAPTAITTTAGVTGSGQSVANLAVQDQSGTTNTWTKYVEFSGSGSTPYAGYRAYTLPSSVSPASVTGLKVAANYRGPASATQTWTWSLYNWTTGTWSSIGTNAGAPDWGSWKLLTFDQTSGASAFVSGTGAIRVQLRANDTADSADVDYEAVTVTSGSGDTTAPSTPAGLAVTGTTASSASLSWTASTDDVGVAGYEVFQGGGASPVATVTSTSATVGGLTAATAYTFTVRAFDAAGNLSPASAPVTATTATSGGLWQPPLNSRWQYQLQGDAAYASTGGVDVDICTVPYTGGACVKPAVFDIDLYADANVAGNNTTLNTAAVAAIHANGAHAICYVDAGGIEKYRPDYQAAVDWDNAHNHQLIGKPYPGFPDESYANINNNVGQRDFLLQRMEARVSKCKQAGFDGVEFDVVNAYEDGQATTGWDISAATQITYNTALADLAHRYGMSVALKNDISQIPQLLSKFDYAINEQCIQYSECLSSQNGGYGYDQFTNAGKAVFQVEYTEKASGGGYTDQAPARCATANGYGFNSIHKNADATLFSQPYLPCR